MQWCGSGSEGSTSFCWIRIRNIFQGSGTGSRSRSEPIAHVPIPTSSHLIFHHSSLTPPPTPHHSFLTLNLSPVLPHPTSLYPPPSSPPLTAHAYLISCTRHPHINNPSSLPLSPKPQYHVCHSSPYPLLIFVQLCRYCNCYWENYT